LPNVDSSCPQALRQAAPWLRAATNDEVRELLVHDRTFGCMDEDLILSGNIAGLVLSAPPPTDEQREAQRMRERDAAFCWRLRHSEAVWCPHVESLQRKLRFELVQRRPRFNIGSGGLALAHWHSFGMALCRNAHEIQYARHEIQLAREIQFAREERTTNGERVRSQCASGRKPLSDRSNARLLAISLLECYQRAREDPTATAYCADLIASFYRGYRCRVEWPRLRRSLLADRLERESTKRLDLEDQVLAWQRRFKHQFHTQRQHKAEHGVLLTSLGRELDGCDKLRSASHGWMQRAANELDAKGSKIKDLSGMLTEASVMGERAIELRDAARSKERTCRHALAKERERRVQAEKERVQAEKESPDLRRNVTRLEASASASEALALAAAARERDAVRDLAKARAEPAVLATLDLAELAQMQRAAVSAHERLLDAVALRTQAAEAAAAAAADQAARARELEATTQREAYKERLTMERDEYEARLTTERRLTAERLLKESEAARKERAASAERLMKEREASEERLLCTVCMEHAKDTLLRPCGHWAVCYACAVKMDHCPLCRAQIVERLHAHV
jgi:hypothetical protein